MSYGVIGWNDTLLDVFRDVGGPPTVLGRGAAMMHGAVYDAVNSIFGTHEPYLVLVPASEPASVEAAIARARTASPAVQFIQADVFTWTPPRRYDTVFFAFWLSHVPPARLPAFWNTVAAALAPGGKTIFIDDGPAVAAYEEVLPGQDVPAVLRRLDDGSRYRVVKVFHDARTLTADLTALGWTAQVRPMGSNLIGIVEPPPRQPRPPDLRW